MVGDILQPTHLLFILVIALLVLGPKRLPEAGRTLGSGLRDFRAAINGESPAARATPDEPEEIPGSSDLSLGETPSHEPIPGFSTVDIGDDEPEPVGGFAVEAAPAADDVPPRLSLLPSPAADEPEHAAVEPAA